MARIQALTQQHALERSFAPSSSRMLSGLSGSSEGVPVMHPNKSSGAVFKAGNLIHLLRLKSFSPHLNSRSGGGLHMMHMPKLSLTGKVNGPRFHI